MAPKVEVDAFQDLTPEQEIALLRDWMSQSHAEDQKRRIAEIRFLETIWPPALIKAREDNWDYAMGLMDGSVLLFSQATPHAGGQWVHLEEIRPRSGPIAAVEINWDRGMDIRLAEIAWVSDAPFGS